MTQSIPSVNSVNNTCDSQEVNSSGPHSVPKGISSEKSSIQSSEKEKKGVFIRIIDSFQNIFKSIKSMFLTLFYRIFYCKLSPSKIERKHSAFLDKLNEVDSFSEELAKKEANKNPVVFTLFGKQIFNDSYNLIWRLWTCIPYIGHKTYYETGKEEAKKDYKALIPHLKSYYLSQVVRLGAQIGRQKIN